MNMSMQHIYNSLLIVLYLTIENVSMIFLHEIHSTYQKSQVEMWF